MYSTATMASFNSTEKACFYRSRGQNTNTRRVEEGFSRFVSYRPPWQKVYGCICISPNDRILLVRGKETGIWSFPKGHMERGETSIQCAKRELHEETGILLTAGLSENGFRRFQKTGGGYFIFYLESEMDVYPLRPWEIEEARWVNLSELPGIRGNVDVSMFRRWVARS